MVISMESKFTEHVGEYLSLILLATVGMMLLVSSVDLLMIFISLELTSLSLYILTAFNKRNIKSAEAALKYFLFGGMSAAFTLFGLSLIYGLSGSTNLSQIGANLVTGKSVADPLLMAALVMTIIGFGFKVAAVPFHLWAPDAYERRADAECGADCVGIQGGEFFHTYETGGGGVQPGRRQRSVAAYGTGLGARCWRHAGGVFRCCWAIWPRLRRAM